MNRSKLIKEWIRRPSILIILIYLKNNKNCYATKIYKETHMTHKTIWGVSKYLSERKFIYKIKDKKKKYIYLTNKGKEFLKLYEDYEYLKLKQQRVIKKLNSFLVLPLNNGGKDL